MKKNWFKRWDFLNVPTSLSYKNEYFYATKVGAFLTIIFFLLITALISYQTIILFKKSSFTLISNQYTDLSQIIDFSQNPFLFQLTNDRGKVIDIDNKLVEIEAYNMEVYIERYQNGTKKNKINNTKIELINCDKLYSNESEYSELNLSSFICIKPEQNLTSFGLLGDIYNAFKGIRLYINKCSGSNCYNDSVITSKLHNSKFLVTYLSLSSNIFYLNNEKLKYQLFTKSCSLSTTVLKKIGFTYNIGRFELYNNIIFGKKISFDYILGNDYTVDVDLDYTSTNKNDDSTVASVSFNYGGNVIETRKEIQTLYQSLSIVGNIFNIILTIFKIINNYYSNKILFVDIFKTMLFTKENKLFNKESNIQIKNFIELNKNNSSDKKKSLDLSNEICINKNVHKSESINSISKNFVSNKKSKTIIEKNSFFPTNNLIFYYLLPLWILKKNRTFNRLYFIKNRICGYFSIEKINELIKFKDTLEDKSLKAKMNNTELIKIKNIDPNNLEKMI